MEEGSYERFLDRFGCGDGLDYLQWYLRPVRKKKIDGPCLHGLRVSRWFQRAGSLFLRTLRSTTAVFGY